ncbi:MAG: TIGR02206 family membrane protein [Pirellulaceae bacterium]|nr:TIGR02206 family membrane protein [Pirellulaceae bacterium]
MDSREFIPFGLSHWVALALTAAAAAGFITLNRSRKISERTKRRVNLGLAWALILAVTADPVLTWLRYRGDGAEYAGRLIIDNSLPLYLCDVVSLVLAAALITRRQRLAEIGYLWGMGGTVQGLLTPTLYFDWGTAEYYAFFIQHGGVPVAAAVLVWGLGLRPQPGAFRRAVLLSWGYMAVVMLLNVLIERNYGFLNGKPEVHTMMDYMGPEPWYLVTLNLVAFAFYALLLLPFRREWRAPAVSDGRADDADCMA